MATRINHLSDFTLYETFTRFDKQVAVPERLRITYFTETGFPRCFVAERNGSEFRNCALSPDGNTLQVYVALSRHYIGTGPVKKIITETLDAPQFPDGERRVSSVGETSFTLWSGNSDTSIEAADESVLQDLLYGYSAYELAKKYGYEGTEQEYAMAPLLAINELSNYAKKDLSNVDMGIYFRTEVDAEGKVTKAGNTGDASWLEHRWDKTIFDGKEEAVTRRQLKLKNFAIGVTMDGRPYVEKEGNCNTLAKEKELVNFAKKDLTNVTTSAFREKNIYPVSSFVYYVDEDHAVTPANAEALAQILYSLSNTPGSLLYAESIASAGGDVGLSPVSFALMAEDPIDYSLSFFGNDEYLHVLRVNGLGAITRQYAYGLDDMATKSFITSSGYRPMRVIDLGSYRDGAFSLDGTPYWGDMQTTLYSYLDGGCGVLLQSRTQFDEPRVFAPTRIYRSGGTLYVIEFMVSATQLCEIRIDEDADVEGGESLFSQQFTAIGSGGGSGTVTTEVYSDINDYNEVK